MSSASQGAEVLDADTLHFDEFSLVPSRRLLLAGDREVRLGSRALDLLVLLVQRAGEFVSYDEIFKSIWPKTVVVEGNLRVHIAGIRKALGDGRDGRRLIVNLPNRGYSFVAPLERRTGATVSPSGDARITAGTKLPNLLHRLVGQELSVSVIRTHLAQHRLVTVVGTGGIGKTSVAITVASQQLPGDIGADGICFVDLASVFVPELVPSAVAAAFGLATSTNEPVLALAQHLQDRRALILLDNCEHVVEPVALMAERLLREAPSVRVLATSREPLRAQGEWVHRLPALTFPTPGQADSAAQAMRFAAVELFVERVSAAREGYELTDEDADILVGVCRKLDGIPLAIELAAARAASIGVKAVGEALEASLTLLAKGRRTAVARHQTLRATLDWSFRLLTKREQRVLVRLATFAGTFTMSSAHAVAGDESLTSEEVIEALLELVDKSLIACDVSTDDPSFRLLETTRSYALEALRRDTEHQTVLGRHARHCLDLLIEAEDRWSSTPMDQWLDCYGRRVDDVRSAVAWAFSDRGDHSLGVAITAKSGLLFFQLSLTAEHRRLAERALESIETVGRTDPRWEFELNVVYGHMLYHTVGLPPERERALERSRVLAEEIGDQRLQALAVSTAWMAAYQTADPQRMLELAKRYEELTRNETDLSWTHMYDRMKAPALHFLGDQRSARECCERGLAIRGIVRPPFVSGSQITLQVSLGTILARALWLQGFAERAEAVVSETLQVALQDGESVALAFTLGIAACPLALWRGDWALARERVQLLLEHTQKHALSSWMNYALAYGAVLLWEEGGLRAEVPLLKLPSVPTPPLIEILATLHPRFVTEQVRRRASDGLSGWCRAEIMRIEATEMLCRDRGEAIEHLRAAGVLARAGGALAWDLRISATLAQVLSDCGRVSEAAQLLDSALAAIQEGQCSRDYVAALTLRQSL